MTAALWAGIGLFVLGVALRLRASKPLHDAYQRHTGAGLPRNWLWTSSPDPVAERWRRLAAFGIVLAWAGAIIAILNPAL